MIFLIFYLRYSNLLVSETTSEFMGKAARVAGLAITLETTNANLSKIG